MLHNDGDLANHQTPWRYDNGSEALPFTSDDASARGPLITLLKRASQDSSLRVLDGDFFVAKLGVGVAKGHAEGLAYLSQFVEQTKSSGTVQKAIDASGFQALAVAPAQ